MSGVEESGSGVGEERCWRRWERCWEGSGVVEGGSG
jgi:hypothetical protein